MKELDIFEQNGITWRPYQNEVEKAIEKNLSKNITKQLIVAATGTGKRIMAIRNASKYKKVLFIAHREELIQQAYEDFETYFPFQTGIVKAERFEIDKRFVVGSVQTLTNRLDKLNPNLFDCIVVDECHHYLAETYIRVLKHFNPKVETLWSATPFRLDGLDMSNIADKIVYDYTIEKAIQEGFLCEIDATRIATQIDISKIKKRAGDFAINELSDSVNIPERNRLIVNRYKMYAEGRSGICFCCSIKHANDVADKFNEFGISAKAISFETPKDLRRQYITDFRNGLIKVLTNVDILTEGFDFSDVGVVMCARPTQSLSLYMQMIGRGTRLKTVGYYKMFGTKSVKVLDFVDNSGNHSLINTYELDQKKRIENRVFMTKERKEELIRSRDKEKLEKIERFAKIQAKYRVDSSIDLFKLPDIRVINSPRMRDDATPAQIKFMQDLGIYEKGFSYTKGQCSTLISNHPCDNWRLSQLAKWGYDISIGATLGQYQEAKKMEENKEAEKEIAKTENYNPFNTINN